MRSVAVLNLYRKFMRVEGQDSRPTQGEQVLSTGLFSAWVYFDTSVGAEYMSAAQLTNSASVLLIRNAVA